jgi:hypothetical protein
VDLIQWCWLLGNLIEGLLFHLTGNRSVTIQLVEPSHVSWTVGDSVAEAFLPKKIRGVTKVAVYKRNMQ